MDTLTKALKQNCPEKCSKTLSDGMCQSECNRLICLWDDNDCDDISPSDENSDHRILFLQTLDFVNILFERTLKKRNFIRNWIPHMPIMLDIEIITGKGRGNFCTWSI